MIKINLTPRIYVDKIYSSIFVAKILLFSGIIISVFAALSVVRYTSLKGLEMDYASLEQEYKNLNEKVAQSKILEAKIKEIDNYISAVDKLNKNRFLYVAFLQDIINNLPDTVWFGGIDAKNRGDFIEVSINLNSHSLEDLLWWYAFLDKGSKRYSELKITDINFNGSFYNTQLSFRYAYL
ncbi:MAG: PilN domain-containing protein [Elusimicrobiales bacterium]|nr:hypothetical protein [Elusimicrobiales bacterium]HOJ85673.1 hypothetical protein [Elusimicrobiales bacterium]HOL62914.1 hypothetical protein [Elusimicrobiales bacterium]HPO96086.1 hypothetical protein [Elusimicrobiales bacterium]